MGLEVLVPLLMGALWKVAGRVGNGVLSAVEDTAKDAATSVFAKVKAWWSSDESASDDLGKFVEEPDIYAPVIEARMVKKLTEDPDKQAELAALLDEIGPEVNVFQTIAEAHGITGAKIETLVRGRVTVDQRIDHASDVTGADIKRMGPQG
jgi:hypothetical protein